MPKLCGSGVPPPETTLNVMPDSEISICAVGPITVRDTASVTEPGDLGSQLEQVRTIEPVYVPGARAPGVAVAVIAIGPLGATDPLLGEIASHEPPEEVTVLVKFAVPPPAFTTWNWLVTAAAPVVTLHEIPCCASVLRVGMGGGGG